MIKSKYVNSNLVFYDDFDYRWVKAIGPAVREWEMRYGSDFTTAKEYTNTQAGTSPTAQAITAGDRALLTTGGTENNGCNLQVIGTPIQFATGKPCYFGAKVSVSEATESDFFVGLASTDTSIYAAHAVTVINAAGFSKNDGATALISNTIKASVASTSTVASAFDTNKHVYEVFFDGATLYYYYDGNLVNSLASGWPTVVMTPSIALMAGSAAARTSLVEWMRVIQLE